MKIAQNPYTQYYQQQVGSDLVGFEGYLHQRGNGWFSRLFTTAIVPSLKWLGLRGLNTAGNVVSDLVDGRNVREPMKDHGIAEVKNAGMVAAGKAIDFVIKSGQVGSGRKRGRPRKQTQVKSKRRVYKRSKTPNKMNFF